VSKSTIVTVVGARPQFIKAAAVSQAIREHAGFREYLTHTGQHYDRDMSELFFDELGLPEPDINLEIGSGTHGAQTGKMLAAIEEVLVDQSPAGVLVYGDTNSTLAGALAAVKLHIPVAHVEAGLRSFNRRMPEEINRILTDRVSDLLFTPTDTATTNLLAEGMPAASIHQIGDVMYDSMLLGAARAEDSSTITSDLGLESGSYALATIHRAENTDDRERLAGVVEGLARVAAVMPVVWPMHPRARAALERHGLSGQLHPSIRVLSPLGFLHMVMLETRARVILTDSGGVQKEAFFNRVPCVTLRDETEWVELVERGVNVLVGTDPASIYSAAAHPPDVDFDAIDSPYGDGDAASKLVNVLATSLL